jgi:hypothetical protein
MAALLSGAIGRSCSHRASVTLPPLSDTMSKWIRLSIKLKQSNNNLVHYDRDENYNEAE